MKKKEELLVYTVSKISVQSENAPFTDQTIIAVTGTLKMMDR